MWYSRKQNGIKAVSVTASKMVSITGIVRDLNCSNENVRFMDNQGAVQMTKSFESSKRSKHIDIKYHFIKGLVINGKMRINYIYR